MSEQNEVLVQTVEQLENEANSRVASLESKLNKAVATAKVSFGFQCLHAVLANYLFCGLYVYTVVSYILLILF